LTRTALPKTGVEIIPLTSAKLVELLGLTAPPFVDRLTVHHQVEVIEQYIRANGGVAVAVEHNYIDRDFIDDHSAFYSKSLNAPPNSCRRLHFFSAEPDDVLSGIDQLLTLAASRSPDEFAKACGAFCLAHYLGFSVIKPLSSCPVGRTVLAPPTAQLGHRLVLHALCDTPAHLRGVPLRVLGLPFQQQDFGVSACATTALWSALYRAAEFEPIRTPTPAQITSLASQYLLPFGRSMPSEGLSIAQMCQAVQATGFAPNLIRAVEYGSTRAFLYMIALSGFAAVLILERSLRGRLEHHAVTLVGVEMADDHIPANIQGLVGLDEHATDLTGLVVHDDRHGPYRLFRLYEDQDAPYVQVPEGGERWRLTHILMPGHPKIRLSVPGLRDVLRRIGKAALDCLNLPSESPLITLDCQITRAYKYLDSLARRSDVARPTLVTLSTGAILSRYVAVVSLSSPLFDQFHVLLDTTTTWRDVQALAIVVPKLSNAHTEFVTTALADNFLHCKVVY
jgi:hypothetical protein